MCKRWRLINRRLWQSCKSLELSRRTISKTPDLKDIDRIVELCRKSLAHIDFHVFGKCLSQKNVLEVTRFCHNLESIDISCYELSCNIDVINLKYCTKIKSLTLGPCKYECGEAVRALFSSYKCLQYLKIVSNAVLTGGCLCKLPLEMNTIILSTCTNIISDELEFVSKIAESGENLN